MPWTMRSGVLEPAAKLSDTADEKARALAGDEEEDQDERYVHAAKLRLEVDARDPSIVQRTAWTLLTLFDVSISLPL
jgi:hypothetical protein